MLPSTLKYLYSVEPVRMHFPVRNSSVQMILCVMLHSSKVDGSMEKKWDTVIPADLKRLFVGGTYMSLWSRKG
jgi:hypothetical protein